jgi:hypothetical protein
MAWSTPLTAVANAALNASQWNASVRDNLAETAPNLATAPTAGNGRWFVSSTTNQIKQRVISENAVLTAAETTISTTYTNLTTNGPILSTVDCGLAALVMISAQLSHATTNTQSWASFEITGVTTSVSNDDRAIVAENVTVGALSRQAASTLMSLTAGANTFRMQYRSEAATAASFRYRRLVVMPL